MILDVGPAAVEALADVAEDLPNARLERPARRVRNAAVRQGDGRLGADRRGADQGRRLVSVAGGGDTVAALNHAGVAGDFTFVSTAGGAFLEWMEGRTLPGVAALEQQGN